MTKELVYVWIGLTIAMVVIPLGFVLYWGTQKVLAYLREHSHRRKEHKELEEIKGTLEEQQDEFITANEYGSFVAPEKEEKFDFEIDEATQSETEELEPVALTPESSEKAKKRLDTLLLEANHLKNSGKFEEYERKLIEGLAIDGEAIDVLKPLSELYFTLGNYKKALSLLKKVSEKDPSDHKAIWQIGEIYFMAGYNQTAELLIEKAINLKNDNPKYYLTMVEIYYNTDRHPEALAYMEKIIKLRPTNPKYLLATAELYEQMGDKDNAKKYYFNVLEYEQNNEKAKAKIKAFTNEL
ncbi:MAG: hypothetical protein Q4B28_03725 [bacterium]|nr:hypothetical protein [bacterium]